MAKIQKEENASPSPVTYDKEALDGTLPSSTSWTISKTARNSFTEQIVKRSAKFPGVGKYNIAEADLAKTRGLGLIFKRH